MNCKPITCSTCPLYNKGQGFVPDKLGKHPRIMMIGEAPGRNEVIKGEPFVGKAGFALHNWLIHAIPILKIAVERGEVTFANTLRCLPPEVQGRPYPRGEEKTLAEAQCRQYDHFTNGIDVVVLFGESPQRCFFREELHAEDLTDRKLNHDLKGVSGRMGRVYTKDGKRWVFAPHPAWILRQPALVAHGQACLRIAANQEQEVIVDYTGWDKAMGELS